MNKIPAYDEMMIPAYEVVLDNDGLCDNMTVRDGIIRKLSLTDDVANRPHKDTKMTELMYRLTWTKTYMKKYGILSEESGRGVWVLSDAYSSYKPIDPDDIVKKVREGYMGVDMPATGDLYVLTNQAFPDYIKVGFAEDAATAAKQLNNTNPAPFPYKLFCTYAVEAVHADVLFRNLLSCISPSTTDFYNIPPEEIYALLTMMAKLHGCEDRLCLCEDADTSDGGDGDIDITPKKKKPPFKFSMVDMHEGDVIQFIHDPSITAVVASDKKILYQGEVRSLSWLAQALLKKDTPVQGTLYFTFEGETLDARRARFESMK